MDGYTLIYDTFIFFNELDILELRLNVLNDVVDYFVLVESTLTFQGKSKPLVYRDNKDRFSKFAKKIIHVVVEDTPANVAPFDREYFQRDAILRGLERCSSDDLVLISDIDEIPNPLSIPTQLRKGTYCAFSQSLFYYQLNCKSLEHDGLPWSLLARFDGLSSPANLRKELVALQGSILAGSNTNEHKFSIIENGGWHFSYLGSPQTIIKKIEAFSHSELNLPEYKNIESIQEAIKEGRDLFGRPLSFVWVGLDSLPEYVKNHAKKYSELGYLNVSEDDSSVEITSAAKDLLFDQYSRYRACVELLHRLGITPRSRVLHISLEGSCLLSKFLSGYDITHIDALTAGITTSQANHNARREEFFGSLGIYDYVIAIDVLEHVDAKARSALITKLSSIAAKTIILAFPYSDNDAPIELDRAVKRDDYFINRQSDNWLEEHEKYGLPSLESVTKTLAALGLHTGSFFHGYTPWLSQLLSYVTGVLDTPRISHLAYRASEEFNKRFYEYDFVSPAYRAFVLGSTSELPANWRPSTKKIDEPTKVQFDAYMRRMYLSLLSELRTIDAQRVSIGVERDIALVEIDKAVRERDQAVSERNKVIGERDQVINECASEISRMKLMQRSFSWRMTSPLRFGARVVRYGLIHDDLRKIESGLRLAYHRLPLPMPLKSRLRDAYLRYSRAAYRMVRMRPVIRMQFHAPSIKPVPQLDTLPDYIIWGVIDWHFRFQRPQQLANALAEAGRRVFYISTCLEDGEGAGFEVEALDNSGRIFQLKLYAKNAPVIYSGAPNTAIVAQLRHSVGEVLEWTNSRQIISLVQHPFWFDIATKMPNSRTVYDCMDHHEGFGNTAPEISALEQALLRRADLVVTTSDWLDRTIAAEQAKRRALIRNGGDFQHFSRKPASVYRDSKGRRVIGYYGAIAEWFDLHLVEAVAKHFQDCCILLVGADTVGAKASLRHLDNVRFIGEVPYAELPYYLHGFDVCLLPFKIIPLTLATNPVKVYEYLSAGKPVVSVDLPEMKQFHELVMVTKTAEDFVDAIAHTLENPATLEQISDRQSFAKEQTWSHRVDSLIQHAESTVQDPSVSVIVVTYNNLNLTRACLQSLDERSDYDRMEIIVVDNASSDGSKEFLADWAATGKNRKLILNEDNRGFAAANNQGLAIAGGDYLVLLNNDTYVTSGWVRTMVQHLEGDKSVGILGPVTNNIGNEAKIEIAYDNMDEMACNAASYTRRHIGHIFDMRTAAFFCVMMPREVYERVGPLDEVFGRGFFEDDDYCRRVEQIGRRVVCAEDVFIHHHLSASFNKLKSQERQALFEQNKKVYEAKWGPWVPHAYREVRSSVVPDASVDKLKEMEGQAK